MKHRVAGITNWIKFNILYNLFWFFLVIVPFAFVIVICIDMPMETRIAAIIGITSSAFFLQKQKLEELHLFVDLFKKFNDRYNALDKQLREIKSKDAGLTPEDKNTLLVYFDLCAEEYLYYKDGYILPSVWQAWKKGMSDFFSDNRVKDLWNKECTTDGYYGFNPPMGN